MNITAKGLIFSMDALIAILIMLMMTVLFLVYCENILEQEKANIDHLSLEKEAIVKLDRALKTDGTNGAAYFNENKHRVEENLVNSNMLAELKDQGIFFSGQNPPAIEGDNCLVLERLALDHESNKVILVGVKVCE